MSVAPDNVGADVNVVVLDLFEFGSADSGNRCQIVEAESQGDPSATKFEEYIQQRADRPGLILILGVLRTVSLLVSIEIVQAVVVASGSRLWVRRARQVGCCSVRHLDIMTLLARHSPRHWCTAQPL